MAKTQRKTATKTSKQTKQTMKTGSRANAKTAKKQQQQSNTFFVMSMSFLAGVLLFANLFMMIS